MGEPILTISICGEDDRTVVALRGEIDESTASIVTNGLTRALFEPACSIEVDCAEVTILDRAASEHSSTLGPKPPMAESTSASRTFRAVPVASSKSAAWQRR